MRRTMENAPERLLDALENIAAELERLRLLREYELGAYIEHAPGGPYVKPFDKPETTEE
jgi:hypothetical protein